MVGYNPSALSEATKEDHIIAGATSGAISRVLSQPLDVVKIRFQIQVAPVTNSHKAKYTGVPQAFRRIWVEEKFVSLWKGHVPAQLLSVGYGVLQYTTFEYLTKAAWHRLPEDFTWRLRPYTHAICGGLSACVATLAVQPIDTIRTRFVAQGEPKTYTSMVHAAKCIISVEGVRGLFKGLVPSLTAVAPNMALQFGFYSALQRHWNSLLDYPPDHHPGPVESFCCGSLAGTTAKSIVHPLDVVKKRLQVQGFEEAISKHGDVRTYTGLRHCVRSMLAEEGVRGFYKGLAPSLLKAALVSATIFCAYDQILIVLATSHSNS